jgi:hypothetical protein
MRDGRQRHGHVLVSLVKMLCRVVVDFYGALVHAVPELPIGISGVPEGPSGTILAKYSEIHSEPYVCTFVNTSPRWQAKLI